MYDKKRFIQKTRWFLRSLQEDYETSDLFGYFAEPDLFFDKLNFEVQAKIRLSDASRYVIFQYVAKLLQQQYETDSNPSYSEQDYYFQKFQQQRLEFAERIYELYQKESLSNCIVVDGDLDDEANSLAEEEGQ